MNAPYEIAELKRLLENIMRYGVIEDADYERALVRVRLDEQLVSGWLPWLTHRASEREVSWDAPELGENVVVLSPGGRTENGMVLPAQYNERHPRPATPDIKYRRHGDGALDVYNRVEHLKLIELPGDGTYDLRIGQTRILADGSSITLKATTVSIEATDFNVMADNARIDAGDLTTETNTASILGDSINLGERTGQPVARVGDSVSNGVITSGSGVVEAG